MTTPLSIEIECLPPENVTETDAAVFKKMVRAADEVDPVTLPHLYDGALVVGLARSANRIVGVGAIKKPSAGYRRSVFQNAKSNLPPATSILQVRTRLVLCPA